MKTIFDPATNDELIQRINMLRENSRATWVKLTVFKKY